MADIQPEATLAREEEGRNLAAYASIAAGIATLAGGIASTVVSNRLPNDSDDVVTLLPALSDGLAGRDIPQGILGRQVAWIGDHVIAQAAGGVLVAIAALLMLIPLRYLFLAIRARNERLGRGGIIATVAGCLLSGVGFLVYTIAFSIEANNFADASVQTSGAARDAISNSVVQAATIIYQLGRFGLALALVILSLNAMRVGLLTRFFGILGILSGVLLVLPIDQPGIIRSVFFIALGLMFLGRWIGGRPPAWSTGTAQPWPSQQELRERRAALARGEDPDADAEDDSDSVPADDPSDPRDESPAAIQRRAGSRKRRKRR
jgi:hypothetical protein